MNQLRAKSHFEFLARLSPNSHFPARLSPKGYFPARLSPNSHFEFLVTASPPDVRQGFALPSDY
ncbi:MAG TPA: hypothetical protein VFY60_09500 [Pyrinomonadaceae bacterium]|nr:hypothetical protein [Pyrinomonadaceae bacterium]